MKLIFNHDGSLKFVELDEYINQGDNLTKYIDVAVEGYDEFTMVANFQLPNGDVNSIAASESVQIQVDETEYSGRRIYLTSAQTLYKGIVKMSLQLTDLNDVTLFTYERDLTINPSVYTPSELQITQAQYNQLMQSFAAYQVKYAKENVRFYSSKTDADNDLVNLAENQIVIIKNNINEYEFWKKEIVGGVATLTKLKLNDIEKLARTVDLLYESKADAISKLNEAKTYANDSVWSISYDPANCILTLKDKNNNVISTIDLPLESTFVNASYDNDTKDLTFTLQNGSTITVPLDDILVGLVKTSDLLAYQQKLVAGKGISIDDDTNVISVSKTITQKDIMWEKLWQSPRQANTNVANLDCMTVGSCASLPIFLKAGTVITLDKTIFENIYDDTNSKAYFGITKIEKESVTDFLLNRYDLIVGNEFTIATDGYYCFSIFGAGTGEIDIIKTYGNPVTFSYQADGDFEPNYVFTKDWGKLKIFIGTNAILPTFDNYIEWACHRQLGKPVIMSNDGKGSINACYLYQYTTNDFTGTRSSVSRQNVIRVKDELWIVGASVDGGVGIGTIQKLLVYPNGWVKYLGRVCHNLGHLNSASYDKEYDILTFGNGSSDYDLEGVGSIIKNLTKTDLYSSYDNEIVLLSDLSANLEQQNYPIATYGFKCNLITIGTTCVSHVKYLNFAMVTNDGNTFRLGKVDVNSLSLANIVWENAVDVGDTSETHDQSYLHAIATATMFNGKLTWAEGHTNTPVAYVEKDRQGNYSLKGHYIELYDGIGNICDYDGKLLVGTSGEITVTDVAAL